MLGNEKHRCFFQNKKTTPSNGEQAVADSVALQRIPENSAAMTKADSALLLEAIYNGCRCSHLSSTHQDRIRQPPAEIPAWESTSAFASPRKTPSDVPCQVSCSRSVPIARRLSSAAENPFPIRVLWEGSYSKLVVKERTAQAFIRADEWGPTAGGLLAGAACVERKGGVRL